MKRLEEYIERINSAGTPEEAFDHFASIMATEGYNRVTYSLVTDHPSLGLPRQHGLATSYPEDWMKHYVQHDYMAHDPVVKHVQETRAPFFWSDLVANPKLPDPSLQLMNEAEESGLGDGIGIPLFGHAGEVVGVGLARDFSSGERDFEFLAGAYLLSVYFHQAYREMLSRPLRVKITLRETEILSWAAEGKTDDEIGTILNISNNTVRFHWKNIFQKLEANGRIYAITKAIRMQLIAPGYVGSGAPYQNR